MNVAFIPVRGGSKSIPLKNIKIINGKPLVYWTVLACCECAYIDKIYVATDSDEIKNTVEQFCMEEREKFKRVYVIGRSEQTANDTASTESAMLEFANNYKFDNIVLVQATSPMLRGEDLDEGFRVFSIDGTDSVLSVVPQKRFIWKIDDENIAGPDNYDVYNRPRRQDFEEYYVENGAFYICRRRDLLNTKNRVSGNIRIARMNEDTFYEIDEPSDWTVVEALMKKRDEIEKAKKEEAARNSLLPIIEDNKATNSSEADEEAEASEALIGKYKMFLTDCDGCLTDGGMYYSEKGDELKKFNTKDGMGLRLLHESGIITGIITGENMSLNRRRSEKLKIDVLMQECSDKAAGIARICKEYNVTPEDIVYVGDDINDIGAMEMVGLACCPADANAKVKEIAGYIATAKGGEGVIREIVDMLMKA